MGTRTSRLSSVIGWTIWLAAVAAGTWLIWSTAADILGQAWVDGPELAYGRLHIPSLKLPPLALYPTVAFALAALYWGLRRAPGRFFRRSLALVLILGSAATVIVPPRIKRSVLTGVPHGAEVVMNYRPLTPTLVLAADGEVICNFTLEERIIIPLSKVKQCVRDAFVAAEDANFWQHDGYDTTAIVRAAIENWRSGSVRQGGSTLTQQVVKRVQIRDAEKTVKRKLREVFLAVELTRKVSKEKVLEVYLNDVYLGKGAYGIEAAAAVYYGKTAATLTLGEAAFLAGMPKAPAQFSLERFYQRAKERQAYVLGRMRETGKITASQERDALAEEVVSVINQRSQSVSEAPHFCTFVRNQLKLQFGETAIFHGGLVVQTTLDTGMQSAADATVRTGLLDLERRLGFDGPTGHDDTYGRCMPRDEDVLDGALEVATVTSVTGGFKVCVRGNAFPMHPDDVGRIVKWQQESKKLLRVGDSMAVRIGSFQERSNVKVRYALNARRTPGLDASLLAMEPGTGYIRAMIGGYDFEENQFNKATQSRRQTGSSIKPLVYAAALMHGKVVTDIVNDRRVCYASASGQWCPDNYEGKFHGQVSLRTALAKSLNSVSVQLAAMVGIDEVIRVMRALGINSPIERVLPVSIGALDLTLWEHTAAYTAIASNGQRMPSQFSNPTPGIFILKVTAVDGQVLYQYQPPPPVQAIPAEVAYALQYLMKGVVEFGTGHRVKELGRPACGKTGTANDEKDVWYMGFTTDLVAGVWVGYTTPKKIAKGAAGGSVALPFWLSFMKAAHPQTPVREFPVPTDGRTVLMPGSDGKPVPFQRGLMPAQYQHR